MASQTVSAQSGHHPPAFPCPDHGYSLPRVQVASLPTSAIDLYWLPLGAGGHSVRLNGLVFEAIAARLQHRDRSDLYHSGLEVRVPEGRFVIEQAPAWGESGERGMVAE